MEQSQKEIIESLQELTKSYAYNIEQLTFEMATTREEIKSGLLQDEKYKQIEEQIKALQKERKIIKEEAMARQNLIAKQQKLKDLTKQRKEKRKDLSEYLLELQRQSGKEQLTLFDGKEYVIKKSATLVKKPKTEYNVSMQFNQELNQQLNQIDGQLSILSGDGA